MGEPHRCEPRRGEPRRGEPRRCLPHRCEPHRCEPRRGKPRRGKPHRCLPHRCEPHRCEPHRCEPRRCGSLRDEPHRCEPRRCEPRMGDCRPRHSVAGGFRSGSRRSGLRLGSHGGDTPWQQPGGPSGCPASRPVAWSRRPPCARSLSFVTFGRYGDFTRRLRRGHRNRPFLNAYGNLQGL